MRVEFKGLERLHEALKRIPEVTIKEIHTALDNSHVVILGAAIKESPINKQTGGGQLRGNIRAAFKTQTRLEITSHAPYSHFVEGGTRPHEISYKKSGRGGLYNKRIQQGFGRHVHHPGTKANPFMRRALTQSQSAIEGFFKAALQKIWESLK